MRKDARRRMAATPVATVFVIFAVCVLTGCASEQLRENTVETSATTSDIIYEMVLSNFAMMRYYNHAQTLPLDYKISSGVIAVNDSAGVTPGGTYGGVHGIVAPTFSIPLSRAVQQQWSVVPTSDVRILGALMTLYTNEEACAGTNFLTSSFRDPSKQSTLKGTYRGTTVWVDPTNTVAIDELTHFTRLVLGDTNALSYGESPYITNAVIELERRRNNDTNAKPVSAEGPYALPFIGPTR